MTVVPRVANHIVNIDAQGFRRTYRRLMFNRCDRSFDPRRCLCDGRARTRSFMTDGEKNEPNRRNTIIPLTETYSFRPRTGNRLKCQISQKRVRTTKRRRYRRVQLCFTFFIRRGKIRLTMKPSFHIQQQSKGETRE